MLLLKLLLLLHHKSSLLLGVCSLCGLLGLEMLLALPLIDGMSYGLATISGLLHLLLFLLPGFDGGDQTARLLLRLLVAVARHTEERAARHPSHMLLLAGRQGVRHVSAAGACEDRVRASARGAL
jgi:hypothetical protein